jgi:hypothetical protein
MENISNSLEVFVSHNFPSTQQFQTSIVAPKLSHTFAQKLENWPLCTEFRWIFMKILREYSHSGEARIIFRCRNSFRCEFMDASELFSPRSFGFVTLRKWKINLIFQRYFRKTEVQKLRHVWWCYSLRSLITLHSSPTPYCLFSTENYL